MEKLKMNQHVTNKNADLLKKNQLIGNRVLQYHNMNIYANCNRLV